MFVFFGLTLLTAVAAQKTCSAVGGYGDCRNGQPCGAGMECIADVSLSGQQVCCFTNEIQTITPTTPPPGACADSINQRTGVSDCPNMLSYCTHYAYIEFLKVQCPVTCGHCPGSGNGATTRAPGATTRPPTNSCVDKFNPTTGISDCPKVTMYCNDPTYYKLMTEECPKTCGRCTGTEGVTSAPGTCVDRVNPNTGISDCPQRVSYCNIPEYYTLMTEECPRTCGRCSGNGNGGNVVPPVSSTCVDKVNPSTGISDCVGMFSYCNNPVYYTLMTQQCPRTCGRCSG